MRDSLVTILDYNRGEVVTYDLGDQLKKGDSGDTDYFEFVIVEIMEKNNHNHSDCYWMSHEGYPTIVKQITKDNI
jgi:hypothetical protein